MERETAWEAFRFIILTAGVGAGVGVVIGIAPNLGPTVVFGPLGLLLAFKGWAVHEGFVKLFGFLIGFLVGAGGAVLTVAGSGGTGGSAGAAILSILVMGVVVGAVSSYMALAYERVFVSVTGLLVAMGVPLLYGLLSAFGLPGGSTMFAILSLPLGVVGAYVAWKSYKGMVILMTAVLGGGLAAAGLSFISGGLGIASFVIVTLVGAFYQLSGASVEGGELGQAAGVRVQRSVTSMLREFWASIVYLFILLPFLINYVVFVDFRLPTSVLFALAVAGPPVLAVINTVRGGSIRSSVAVGVVPTIWLVLAEFVDYSSRLIRYRQCNAVGWTTQACLNIGYVKEPVLSVNWELVPVILGVGLGLAAVGVLIGMGYNRFVGSVSGGAPGDSDAV